MARELTKVVYKPDSQKSEEYIIIVNPTEVRCSQSLIAGDRVDQLIFQYKKWSEGGV